MTVPVLTAVTGAPWEADLVSELDRGRHGVRVVRRCVDLADLLSAVASGTARAALLSAELRRLDRDTITWLAAAGVAVVGLVEPGDHTGERRLLDLGVANVMCIDAGPDAISSAVRQAVSGVDVSQARRVVADPRAALPDLGLPPVVEAPPPGRGKVIAVWGPTGAPGRTTLALGIADEAARLGVPTMLVDADVYGGVVAAHLGLLDESPGLAAASRQAGQAALDPGSLAKLAWTVRPMFRVLTGIPRADRWPELRPTSVSAVLMQARRLAALTVLDCGFSIEQDEEISYDTMAPRRNGVTLAALDTADIVLCVGSADPVGLQRLVRALADLRELLPARNPYVVVNRVRRGVIPGDPRREVGQALARYANVTNPTYLSQDSHATDAALGRGRTLAEVAPNSPLRRELAELTKRLLWTGELPDLKEQLS